MKFKILKSIILIPILSCLLPLTSCNSSNTITISEVTHSLFYAPLYIANNKGFFSQEGIDVNIITTPGVTRNVS